MSNTGKVSDMSHKTPSKLEQDSSDLAIEDSVGSAGARFLDSDDHTSVSDDYAVPSWADVKANDIAPVPYPDDKDLSDAFDLSEIESSPEAKIVVGQDTRERVDGIDIKKLPWSAICHLYISYGHPNRRFIGTGFLVQPGVVVTAGHVIRSKRYGYAEWIRVSPGRLDDDDRRRFQFVNPSEGLGKFEISPERKAGNWASAYDYGGIVLPNPDQFADLDGLRVDKYEKKVLRKILKRRNLSVSGYPTDRERGTQWRGTARPGLLASRTIAHFVDTYGGQSGSPLYFIRNDGRASVIGIHVWGGYNAAGQRYNAARRADQTLIDAIKSWLPQAQA